MTSVVRLVAGTVGVVGLAVVLGSGYLVVRGPFLGGPTLAPRALLATLGAFVVGVTVAAWGATRYARL
ncbi:hypothetical protein [Haloplanus halophilus]|uniref:hypothetical protein n=1 Tax=Haloplanus halophilus TaxID=2949993 RepID=UPI00203FFCC5|nr:hypothetical protein [Haloplanus sp. GDY1]